MNNQGLIAGLVGLGGLFGATWAWTHPNHRLGGRDDLDTVIDKTVEAEASGRWDAINPNPRPPYVAMGPVQWTLSSGHLGTILAKMRAADWRTFDAVTAPWTAQLLTTTAARSPAPIGGYRLWSPTWTSRLTALMRHPPFVAVMRQEARTGIHMQQAIKAAKLVRLMTVRGLSLAFDQSIRQGEYGIVRTASALAQRWGGSVPSYADRLAQFAAALEASSGHASDVVRRVRSILADRSLSDSPVTAASV